MIGRAVWQYLLFVALVVVTVSSPVSAQTAREIAQKTFPSVVLLATEDGSGRQVSLGSGFFVQADVVATNFHMLQGASKAEIRIVGQDEKYGVLGVVSTDSERDLALPKVIGVKGPTLPLGDDSQIGPGDSIYAVGNPRGFEGTFSQGIVSGVRRSPEGTLFQITAPLSPGSSGGPILNLRGEVIAVAVAQVKDAQNLNFAVPVSYLRPLIVHMGPVAPLARVMGPPPSARAMVPVAPPARVAPNTSAYAERDTQFRSVLEKLATALSPSYRIRSGRGRCDLTIEVQQQARDPIATSYIVLLASLDGDRIDVVEDRRFWLVVVRTKNGNQSIRRQWGEGSQALEREMTLRFATTSTEADQAKSDLQRAISLCE